MKPFQTTNDKQPKFHPSLLIVPWFVHSTVTMEFLCQGQSIFAANSKYTRYKNIKKAEQDYSSRAIQEQNKFEKVTINKYGGFDYSQ